MLGLTTQHTLAPKQQMNTFRLTILAVALFATTSAVHAAPKVTLRVWIDGLSQLVIQPGGVQWSHLEYGTPGRQPPNTNAPTVLDGFEWYPVWPSTLPCCSGQSSSTLSTQIAPGTNSVSLTTLAGRGSASISQQPTDANGRTLIVTFDDRFSPGADWYEVVLTGVSFGVLPSIEVSQVRVSWPSLSNVTYRLQYSSSVTTNQWVDLLPPIPGTGTTIAILDAVASERRFYRVLPVD